MTTMAVWAQVIEILHKNGLTEITVEQPPTLKNSNIYTVFAIRKALTESGRTSTTSAEVSGRMLVGQNCVNVRARWRQMISLTQYGSALSALPVDGRCGGRH